MSPDVTAPRPHRRAPLVALLAGHAISLTGNMLTVIAVPLYVLAETGSAAATGLTGAFATAPMVFGGVLGGVFVDRIGYRRASVLSDVVSGVTIGAVPLLAGTVGLPFWALLALVFTGGLLDTPGQTARHSLLPDAAAAAGVPVERAVGLYEAAERGARLIGAPVAGLLVATIGPLPVLVFDAATFAVSAALVAAAVTLPAAGRQRTDQPDGAAGPGGSGAAGYWRDLVAGVRFLWRDRLLRAVAGLILVTNCFDAAKSTVLLPVVADRELGGATAFGLLVAAMGGGALLGSLAFGAVGHRLPRRATFVVAFAFVAGPPYWGLAAAPPLPVLLAVFLVCGFAAGAINPMLGAIHLERVPPGMRARVYGVSGALAWAAMPVGALGAGLATERLGTTPTLLAVSGCYLLVVLLPLRGGPWRTMRCQPVGDQRQQPPVRS